MDMIAQKMPRIIRIFKYPVNALQAKFAPVAYAKRIGVRVQGRLTIYGSSYEMFGSEPYLVSTGDNAFISVGVKFVAHDGAVLPFRRETPSLDLAAPIHLGENTFLGIGAMVLKGVIIGDNCIVGAGSVVTKSVPDGQIVAGNPARVITTTKDFLARAHENSLGIGHLPEMEKHRAYKKHFKIDA
jgi:acetyltransferase-like isoleucine patch superfamily enzyme